MISDDDFRQNAEALVNMYGRHAEHRATLRMDMYLRNGSPENAEIWRQVRAVIREMQRQALQRAIGQNLDQPAHMS